MLDYSSHGLRVGRSGGILNFLSLLTMTYMIWRGACVLANSSSPAMVVISESMAPAFHRGDILVLWNRKPLVEVGDIPVCWFSGSAMPMVHRAVKVYHIAGDASGDGFEQHILTKGDNNELTDESLYPKGQRFVYRHQVVGIAKAYIPYLGWATIVLNQYGWFKFVVLCLGAIAALVF